MRNNSLHLKQSIDNEKQSNVHYNKWREHSATYFVYAGEYVLSGLDQFGKVQHRRVE